MEPDSRSSTNNHLRGRPHVVLVPCPLQGHLTPMFHLAMTLHSNGFSITIILIRTHPYSRNPFSNNSAFFVEHIDGEFVDGETDDSEDVMPFLLAINRKLEEPFREVLERVVSDRSRGRVSCIVQDSIMYLAVDAAKRMEIPRLVLRTSSVTNFLGLLAVIDHKARCAAQENNVDGGFREELSSIRAKDMPVFDRGCSESAEQVLSKTGEGTRTAVAIIWNTINCLEKTSLDTAKASFSVPIFDVGPLHISTPQCPRSLLLGDQEINCIELLDSQIPNFVIYTCSPQCPRSLLVDEERSSIEWLDSQVPNSVIYTSSSQCPRSLLGDEERSCIEWLDSQIPNSVIYVSTGSLVTLTTSELTEMALGLALSGQPFLWVTRDGLLKRLEGHVDVAGLVGTRGKITKWAPQREVLRHGSVGGFWTHNGWNSTLESICEGVPMLTWPRVGDQRVAARLVSEVWRVGLELEVGPFGVERGKIASAITRLMEGEESLEMKKRAMELKEKVEGSLRFGGSSFRSRQNLLNFISSLQKN